MKKIIFLLAISISGNLSLGQTSSGVLPVDLEILNKAYNNQFQAADSILSERFTTSPQSLKNYFLALTVETARSLILRYSADTENRFQVTDSLNDVMLSIGEEAIEKFKDNDLNLNDKFYLGGIYGYLARIYGFQRSWIDAYSYGKKGKNLFEEIVETDPNFYDAYLLLGMFNYYGARISGFSGFIAKILGMGGDRSEGLMQMKTASKLGLLTRTQADMMLAEVFTRQESNPNAAIPYLKQMVKSFPNNGYFLNLFVDTCLDADLLDEAQSAVEGDSNNLLREDVLARYYHTTGDYELSNEYILNYYQNIKNHFRWRTRRIDFIYAVNLMFQGDEETARKLSGKFRERQKKQFDILFDLRGFLPDLFEFSRLIAFNKDSVLIEQKIEHYNSMRMSQINYGLIEFQKGIYYFKTNRLTQAENSFIIAKKYIPEFTLYDSIDYLMLIYTSKTFPVENVEKLIEEINELELEDYQFRSEDLETKYDL